MHTQYEDIKNCVEIFGLNEWHDYTECLKIIVKILDLNFNDVEYCVMKGNGLLVKLVSDKVVNEWERKSRERRLKLNDIKEGSGDNKVKIFAAAPTKYKLLLHTVRKILPYFKYIWIGKRGVMARHRSRSQIYLIKNEDDIIYVKNIY